MTGRLPDPGRSRVVLIGASAYDDPELPALPGVDRNVDDLVAVLTAKRGTGLPERNCAVLRNPRMVDQVGQALAKAAREAEDMLLVYYAGHGLTWTLKTELYLAMSASKVDTVGTSALRCADVRQAFLDSRARTRVLVLDCCFAGRAIERTMSAVATELLVDEVDVEGAYILAATAGPAVALAPDNERNTLFTGHLLRALRDGVPGAGDLLTLDVLYRHLTLVMTRSNGPLPRSNGDGTAAHLALARNPAPEVARLRAELERVAADVTALAGAVDALAELDATVRGKVVDPVPSRPVAALLRAQGLLAAIEATAHVGEWAGVAAALSEVDELVAQGRARVAEGHAHAQGLLDRRDELRGRLAVYQAMATRLGVAEDPALSAAHRAARELLWTGPCGLDVAEIAVNTYQRMVIERREGRTRG